jgi:hypothetical protein
VEYAACSVQVAESYNREKRVNQNCNNHFALPRTQCSTRNHAVHPPV